MTLNDFAVMDRQERAVYFVQTGARHNGIHPVIVEKDFWVCWILRILFGLGDKYPHMVFKGGTSLSKAFKAIARFSEDVDISLGRDFFGYAAGTDPATLTSRNKQKHAVEQLQTQVKDYVQGPLLASLRRLIREVLQTDDWSIEIDGAAADGQALTFSYPSTQPADALPYVRQSIKIEFGGRSDQWPSKKYTIRPFVAESYPELFQDSEISVKVLDAERTFWEKATAIHAFANFPAEKPLPSGSSRHYYDLLQLHEAGIARSAMSRSDLLDAVREHKSVFFRDPKAKYDEAKVGTLSLAIPSSRYAELSQDYAAMLPMIYTGAPSFNALQARMDILQERINQGAPPPLNTSEAFAALAALPICNLGLGRDSVTMWYRGRLAQQSNGSWFFWMENGQGPYATILNAEGREWHVSERNGIYISTTGRETQRLILSERGIGPPGT